MAVQKTENGEKKGWQVNKIKGEQGNVGNPGITIRTTVWEAGKEYFDGKTLDGDTLYLDIVTDKAIGTDDQNDPEHKVNYYMCTNYHISSDAVTYEDTDFWSPVIDTTKPIKTPLVLADKIQADFIDVDDLHVKHLDGADGTFSGTLSAASGSFSGNITAMSGDITGRLNMTTGDIYGHGELVEG